MFKKKRKIEAELKKTIAGMGEKTKLRDACEYALMNGGKRLRPLIVLSVADALGHGLDVMPAALSVEFFHTASLIADDLPCMDNDNFRRNHPSLHRVFEEGVALLASYTFVAAGYAGIYNNGLLMKKDPRFSGQADLAMNLSLEIATRHGGIFGATGGQFLDLFPPNRNFDTIRKIIEQKTVTLFQVSFAFGWLFGGGDPALLQQVEKTAYHLGMAFQISDDLQDVTQDMSKVNIASAMGLPKAIEIFEKEIEAFETGMKNLGIWNLDFAEAAETLKQQVPAAT